MMTQIKHCVVFAWDFDAIAEGCAMDRYLRQILFLKRSP